jgi:hypothetical protein
MHEAVAPVAALASAHGVELRQADVGGAALAGGHARDHLRAVIERRLGVEGAGVAGHALGDDLGVLVYEIVMRAVVDSALGDGGHAVVGRQDRGAQLGRVRHGQREDQRGQGGKAHDAFPLALGSDQTSTVTAMKSGLSLRVSEKTCWSDSRMLLRSPPFRRSRIADLNSTCPGA